MEKDIGKAVDNTRVWKWKYNCPTYSGEPTDHYPPNTNNNTHNGSDNNSYMDRYGL